MTRATSFDRLSFGEAGRESSSQLGGASTDKAATGSDRPRLPRSLTQTNTWLLLKKLLTRIRTLLSILTNKQTNKTQHVT